MNKGKRDRGAKAGSTIADRLEWVFSEANRDLSAPERLLLAYVAFRDGSGECWGTIEALSAATGLGARTVRRAVRVLEGAVEWEDHPAGRLPLKTRPTRIRRSGNRWKTCREPVDKLCTSGGESSHGTVTGRPAWPGGAATQAKGAATQAGTGFASPPSWPPEQMNKMMNRDRPAPAPLEGGRGGPRDGEAPCQSELPLLRVVDGLPDHRHATSAIRQRLAAEASRRAGSA